MSTVVYAIWATNGKEEKEKIFFNQKKAHDAAVACKKKGLKFFAMSAEEIDELIKHFCQKIEWFCKSLENKQFSAFGATD